MSNTRKKEEEKPKFEDPRLYNTTIRHNVYNLNGAHTKTVVDPDRIATIFKRGDPSEITDLIVKLVRKLKKGDWRDNNGATNLLWDAQLSPLGLEEHPYHHWGLFSCTAKQKTCKDILQYERNKLENKPQHPLQPSNRL